MQRSDCCDAPISGEVTGHGEDACGRCSKCGEMSGVYNDDEGDEALFPPDENPQSEIESRSGDGDQASGPTPQSGIRIDWDQAADLDSTANRLEMGLPD
jgi:hypothetical protein